MFPRSRPVQTALIHAFPYDAVTPIMRLYSENQQGLDGLSVEGRVLRVWAVPEGEQLALEGKLYVALGHPGFKPHAMRLENAGSCDKTYWLGQVDIAPQDQPIEGGVGDPPPMVQP